MANQFSTGAVSLFVGTGASNAPQLLGQTEGSPRIEVETAEGIVTCDLTGDVELDAMFLGCRAAISFNLTRWDNTVAHLLERRPGPTSAIEGAYNASDIGSFYQFEQFSFPIWLRFLFGSGATAKAAYTGAAGANAGPALPGGYQFLSCRPIGQWGMEVGARPMKRQFMFRAWPKPDFTQGTNPKFTLFNKDMSAVSALSLA